MKLDGSSRRTLLVLVHGFLGGRKSWGNTPSLLMRESHDFDVAMFEYPTSILPWGLAGIEELSETLVQEIIDLSSQRGGYMQCGLAGHGLGGLIVPLATEKLRGEALRQPSVPVPSGLLCIGTPWDGVNLAPIWPFYRQVNALGPKSIERREAARTAFKSVDAVSIWAKNLVCLRDGVVEPQSVDSALPRYWARTTHAGAVAVDGGHHPMMKWLREWASAASSMVLLTYLRALRQSAQRLAISPVHSRLQNLFESRSASEWSPVVEANGGRGGGGTGPRDRLDDVVQDLLDSSDPLVNLTGEGGAGKTSTMVEMARRALDAAINESHAKVVPVLVRTRGDPADASKPITPSAAFRNLGSSVINGDILCNWLEGPEVERPPLLVIADGLDEASASQLAQIDALPHLLHAQKGRLVVAGRPESVLRGRHFKIYRLDALTEAQIRSIAQRQLGDSDAEHFLTWLEGTDRTLASNVGAFEMLMRLWTNEQHGPAPRTMGSLYQTALPYLFGRQRDPEEAATGPGRELSDDDRQALVHEAINWLAEPALDQMTTRQQPSLANLTQELRLQLQSASVIEGRSLSPGDRSWRFASERWAEYFASRALLRLKPEERASIEIATPSMLNVWRMAAGESGSLSDIAEEAFAIHPVLGLVVLAAGDDDSAALLLSTLLVSILIGSNKEMIDLIVEVLRDTPGNVSEHCLASIARDAAVPVEMRERAALALHATTKADAVAAVRDVAVPERFRWEAAGALHGTADADALATLQDAGAPEDVRREAATALRGTADADALAGLVSVVRDAGAPEEVRREAGQTLCAAPPNSNVAQLIGLLNNRPEWSLQARHVFISRLLADNVPFGEWPQ